MVYAVNEINLKVKCYWYSLFIVNMNERKKNNRKKKRTTEAAVNNHAHYPQMVKQKKNENQAQ